MPMSTVTVEAYRGNPMIVIRQHAEEQYPFQFGVRRAQLVLSHLEDIRQFVEKHQKVATR
jgi:hypothetical protein